MPRLIHRVARWWARILTVACVALFVATSLTFQWHAGLVEDSRIWLKHSNEVLIVSATAGDALGRSEAVAKGFLVDADPAERKAYFAARAELDAITRKLSGMVADNPSQAENARRLIVACGEVVHRLDEAIARRSLPKAARDQEKWSVIRRAVAEARAAVAVVDAEELRIREIRRAAMTRRLSIAYGFALASIATAAMFGVCWFVGFRLAARKIAAPSPPTAGAGAGAALDAALEAAIARARNCERARLDDQSVIAFLRLRLQVLADRLMDGLGHKSNLASIADVRAMLAAVDEVVAHGSDPDVGMIQDADGVIPADPPDANPTDAESPSPALIIPPEGS